MSIPSISHTVSGIALEQLGAGLIPSGDTNGNRNGDDSSDTNNPGKPSGAVLQQAEVHRCGALTSTNRHW
jgi:hypothetical protein